MAKSKTLSPEDLLAAIRSGQGVPGRLLITGDDAYLYRELKKALSVKGYEVAHAEFKKGGPERDQEDLSMGGSLFASASLLWITKCTALSGWKAEAKHVWARMAGRADGQGFFLWAQVPLDRRANWSGLDLEAECRLDVDEARRPFWIKRMNEERGGKLSADRLDFLAKAFDESLLNYDNWVELWCLGGDAWAEVTLGWGDGRRSAQRLLAPQENAAFSWVDSVLGTSRDQRARATWLLDHLLEQGQEPLQLLGLIGKSLRILAALERGETPQGQPEFLVGKMRNVLRGHGRTKRGLRLLGRCAEIDRLLKSTASNPRALLNQLSTV